jgi:hypothetical protein
MPSIYPLFEEADGVSFKILFMGVINDYGQTGRRFGGLTAISDATREVDQTGRHS